MPPPPNRRFVRLSLTDAPGNSATVTLLSADPMIPVDTAAEAVPWVVEQIDPARAARLRKGIASLLAREGELFDWMERDPANGFAFLNDPRAALRVALPDFPVDTFD